MKRRTFLALATASALLAPLRHAGAAGPSLFHDHGHGLAFSPDGKALLAPTHDGLAAYENGAWWQAGGPAQGFSGFSVAERVIYASGHSRPGDPRSAPAGLMRSLDGGRTWQALALAGEADFHLLAAGYRSRAIYVLNPRANRAMPAPGIFVTRDEGASWRRSNARGLAGELHALAAHPAQPDMVAAGCDSGLYLSHDAGARFVRLERGAVTALLFDLGGERLLYAKPLSDDLFARAPRAGAERHASAPLPPLPGDYVTCLAQTPVDPRVLAVATRRRDVYLARDGRRWQRIATGGEALERPEDNDSSSRPGEPR